MDNTKEGPRPPSYEMGMQGMGMRENAKSLMKARIASGVEDANDLRALLVELPDRLSEQAERGLYRLLTNYK